MTIDSDILELATLDPERHAEYLRLDGTPLCGCLTARGNQCNEAAGPSKLSETAWLHLHRRLACKRHRERSTTAA